MGDAVATPVREPRDREVVRRVSLGDRRGALQIRDGRLEHRQGGARITRLQEPEPRSFSALPLSVAVPLEGDVPTSCRPSAVTVRPSAVTVRSTVTPSAVSVTTTVRS